LRVALIALLLALVWQGLAEARRGCCSHHGGVCGCKCCDGTPLSATCAPYYPACNEKETKPASATPTPKAEVPVEFTGLAVRILDGDTIEVMHGGKPERIRLPGIDCPEKSQAFGNRAKQFTADLVGKQTVTVQVKDRDRYGRTVGVIVLSAGRTLNQELVRAGLAWWYKQYAAGDTVLQKLEEEARAAKVGLWVDPSPVAPWDFRHRKK